MGRKYCGYQRKRVRMSKFQELYESICEERENKKLLGPEGTHSLGGGFYGKKMSEPLFHKVGTKFNKVASYSGLVTYWNRTNDKVKDPGINLRYHDTKDPDELHVLAHNKEWNVRAATALNKHLAPDTVEKLGKDKVDLVRKDVASRKDVSVDDFLNDPSDQVRGSLAARPDLTRKHFEKLSKDSDAVVRGAVASNKNVPDDIVERLLKDEDAYVSSNAERTVRLRRGALSVIPKDAEESPEMKAALEAGLERVEGKKGMYFAHEGTNSKYHISPTGYLRRYILKPSEKDLDSAYFTNPGHLIDRDTTADPNSPDYWKKMLKRMVAHHKARLPKAALSKMEDI